MAKKESKQK